MATWPARTWVPAERVTAGMMNATRDQLNELHSYGLWLDVPFNAANFTANGGATWTLGLGAILKNRYMVIGKTLTWSFYVSWFSGSNTLAGAGATALIINLPGGYTSPGSVMLPASYSIDGGARVGVDAAPNGTSCAFYKQNGTNWTAGSPGIVSTLTFEIQ
jgi:hypothetical protein